MAAIHKNQAFGLQLAVQELKGCIEIFVRDGYAILHRKMVRWFAGRQWKLTRTTKEGINVAGVPDRVVTLLPAISGVMSVIDSPHFFHDFPAEFVLAIGTTVGMEHAPLRDGNGSRGRGDAFVQSSGFSLSWR